MDAAELLGARMSADGLCGAVSAVDDDLVLGPCLLESGHQIPHRQPSPERLYDVISGRK